MTIRPRTLVLLALPALAAFFLAGCDSNVRPLKPLQRVELWVPDDGSPAIELAPPTDVPPATPALALAPATESDEPATQSTTEPATLPAPVIPINIRATTEPAATQPAETLPATAPATQVAATQPALPAPLSAAALEAMTRPGRKVVKIIDRNQTARFVYKASYDNIWQKAMLLTSRLGFTLDRHDYRLGVLTTQPLPSAQIVEPWKPENTTAKNMLENTTNSQRRIVRVTIATVPGKPDFYQVAVQVIVERETNPSEIVGGPIFVEGSGFGRNIMALRSDYATLIPEAPQWIILGHDTQLEKKLLDEIFKRI